MPSPPLLHRCGSPRHPSAIGRRWALRLASLAAPALLAATPAHANAPWWEQYEQKERYICPQRGLLVLERNADQASLISGRHRSTLFREAYEGPDLRYRDGRLLLILRGDELTLEDLPQRFTCVRTEQV